MAANVATGKGAADMVEVVDEGGATVDPTGGELSLWPGVEEHAASATTSATMMTLPDLMIVSPTFLVSIHRPRMCRRQPVWNSIESMIGTVSSITSSKRSSGATTVIARVSTDMPSGRSTR